MAVGLNLVGTLMNDRRGMPQHCVGIDGRLAHGVYSSKTWDDVIGRHCKETVACL
jgi:hypothetical protein